MAGASTGPAERGAPSWLVGAPMPPLVLASTLGGRVDLARLAGTTVIYLYPWTGRPGVANPPGWDDIPGAHGSTPETEGFRDLYPRFRARGIEVMGLSGQDTDWQRELSKRLRLPFALLADPGLELAAALGLPTFRAGETTYLRRLTLVVEAARIRHVFAEVSDPAGHAGELLGWVGRGGGVDSDFGLRANASKPKFDAD